jgi:hypothetical protein
VWEKFATHIEMYGNEEAVGRIYRKLNLKWGSI